MNYDLNSIAWVWGVTLAVAGLVITPLAVHLLRRASRAARNTRIYAEEMLAAGGSIAGHTGHTVALNNTLATAGTLLAASEALAQTGEQILAAVSTKS